jgi:hypothetical protein
MVPSRIQPNWPIRVFVKRGRWQEAEVRWWPIASLVSLRACAALSFALATLAAVRRRGIALSEEIGPKIERKLVFHAFNDTYLIDSKDFGGPDPYEPARMVSRPWPPGPASDRRSRMAKNRPRKPRTEKIHIPRA